MDRDFLKKWNAVKNKIYGPRVEQTAKSTLCFFTNDAKQESKPAGCGVFIKVKEKYFVITAAHVLAEHLTTKYIIMEDNAITLGGRAISSPMPATGAREDDKIDLTVLMLDSIATSHLLQWYTPVDIDVFLVNHEIEYSPKYFCYGYPLTRTKKIWGKNEIKSVGHAYQSQPAKEFDFERFGFSNETHFAIAFDGGVTSASNPDGHLSPDLTGISGSGLWFFYDKEKLGLLGVVIERINQTGQKAIIVTRLEEVLKIISQF